MADPRGGPDPNTLLLAAAIGLVLWLIAAAVFAQPVAAERTLATQQALAASRAAIGQTLSPYRLLDEDGQPVSLARYRGKPLLVSFVYTGCFSACPVATEFLAKAIREARRTVGPDSFNAVTVGFNLPFDTPTAMRDFRRRHAASAGNWAFLAGDESAVQGLAREVGFRWVATASGFDHITQLTLVAADGRIADQIYGDTFELPRLITPLKALVLGGAAPMADWREVLERVRLLCTVYDARSGAYRLDYSLFIEIFAGLSVLLGILFYLGREWRRHRSSAPRSAATSGRAQGA